MRKICLFLILIMILDTSCDKEDELSLEYNIDCSSLSVGLLEKDLKKVESEINQIIENINSSASRNNIERHKADLEGLVEQINKCKTIQVVNTCFQCIYTNPPQTEINMIIVEDGHTSYRTIDLLSRDNKFVFVGVHE